MKIYNEVKYLEPPLPFRSFVRHISKYLSREVQITLMIQEIAEISELEKILDIFQNIRDREIGRRQNPLVPHTNGNHNQSRGYTTAYRGARRDNGNHRNEMWQCSECEYENFATRTVCYRCNKARGCQRNNVVSTQHSQQQRGGDSSRGGGNTMRGRGRYSSGSTTVPQGN